MTHTPHAVERSALERIPSTIDRTALPHHVAIVMDGNGRWATDRGLSRSKGHEQGEQALYDVIYGARDLGIEWVTTYAFSTENWKRPAREVAFLMNFNEKLLLARTDELHEHNVRIRFVGRRERRIPSRLIKRMDEAQDKTKKNTGLNLCIAFNYGGRAEIVDAVKSLAAESSGDLASRKITEKSLASHLYCSEMPDVDLVLRSSGEHRLSNFMLWQAAYAELVFTDTLWPDIRREDLFDAVVEFQRRHRRFGA
ncbi:MAG TPA: polyprenyl diphosphate synthase [Acidimicrobiia bacterium]|nr:polyprenyl diphosphate synthase [Acidimicrobiia bacterium]